MREAGSVNASQGRFQLLFTSVVCFFLLCVLLSVAFASGVVRTHLYVVLVVLSTRMCRLAAGVDSRFGAFRISHRERPQVSPSSCDSESFGARLLICNSCEAPEWVFRCLIPTTRRCAKACAVASLLDCWGSFCLGSLEFVRVGGGVG